MTAIDTDGNTYPHIPLLKTRGVTAVGRYYSSRPRKRLTQPEAAALSDAGIQIFAVFEDRGDPQLSFESGVHDAQIALQQARSVGQPDGSAIYFALEHLPNGYDASHLPGIRNYYHGLKQVLGDEYKLGVYSDGVVCDALLQDGLCDYAWLSASTSFPGSRSFDRSSRWAIAQRNIDIDWMPDLSIDTNDTKDDFGAFRIAAAPAPVIARTTGAPGTAAAALVSVPGPAAPVVPATGWTLLVQRLRTEKRASKPFARTVGTYQVYVDGQPMAGLTGMTVEREGPGDNGPVGKADHRCIEAGTYPLRGHDTENYATVGYDINGYHPRPAIEIGDTGSRTGILIHPANGYGSTIGCINLANSIDDAGSDFLLEDSTARVIALIDDLTRQAGAPLPHDGAIANCHLVVADSPIDQIGSQLLRLGSRGPLVEAWQAFLEAQGFGVGPAETSASFGMSTRNGTLAFQNANGLDPDGTVGPQTIAAAIQLGFGAPTAMVAPSPTPARFDATAATTRRMTSPAATTPSAAMMPPAEPAGISALAMMTAPPLAFELGGAIVAAPPAAPMQALRIGMRGPFVLAWQNFLIGARFDPGGADGFFGDQTQTATMAFQSMQGLKADGVVGQQTFLKAMGLGFHLVEEPDTDDTGTNFPPRPSFRSLQSTSQRMALFGHFDFAPAPASDEPERIRILGSWVKDNISPVSIPQLRKTRIPNPPETIQFHRLAAGQLQAMWVAWEKADLLDLILSYDGSFAPRFKRGQAFGGPEALSNHAFGSAFDINAASNVFGRTPALAGQRGSVRKLVPIANEHGFYWGGHFSGRPDGMHFEVAFLQSSDVPSA
jgi:peptidoglycan hydrolase-like protein with peptidoglycan-binding domain